MEGSVSWQWDHGRTRGETKTKIHNKVGHRNGLLY